MQRVLLLVQWPASLVFVVVVLVPVSRNEIFLVTKRVPLTASKRVEGPLIVGKLQLRASHAALVGV